MPKPSIPRPHFHTFLTAQAEQQPDKVALRVSRGAANPDSFAEHSYAQLHARVLVLSRQLRAIAPSGERALILTPSGAEFVIAFLACLHAGLIAVPAYPPPRNRNRDRVLSIHDDAQPAVILTTVAAEGNVREALPDTKARVVVEERGRLARVFKISKGTGEPPALPLHNPDSIAFLQYTSGSTGAPKGAVLTHENLLASLDAIQALFQHEGELYVTGRVKDLIIIRGRNLHPHDIESCVGAQPPAATGANSIAAFEFSNNGSESSALGLLIETPRTWVSGLRKGIGEITAHVRNIRQAVAESFEVTTDLIAFVAPGDFPRTSSGKVQRSASRNGVLSGSLPVIHRDQLSEPDDAMVDSTASSAPRNDDTPVVAFQPPTTGVSSFLAAGALIQQLERGLLDFLRREKLGNLNAAPHDATFSSLGIDSLGAALLAIEIEKIFGVEQPFEAQDGASVTLGGKRCAHLSSYSYLGLMDAPEIWDAMQTCVETSGASSHGSRMLANGVWHSELETRIAYALQSDAAITFGNDFSTNWAVISTLMSAEDTIIADERIHASLVDGCKGSGATFTLFRHNNLKHLAELLAVPTIGKTLVVIDADRTAPGAAGVSPPASLVPTEQAKKWR